MSERVVYAFRKNRREEVRASLANFRGSDLAHVRIFAGDTPELAVPTTKGISIRVEQLPDLLAAVQALIDALPPQLRRAA